MPTAPNRPTVRSLTEALNLGPPPPGNLAVPVFAHGTMEAELYTPQGHDPPDAPHSATRSMSSRAAGAGSSTATAATPSPPAPSSSSPPAPSTASRTSPPTSAVWVVFYGPQGGEPATG